MRWRLGFFLEGVNESRNLGRAVTSINEKLLELELKAFTSKLNVMTTFREEYIQFQFHNESYLAKTVHVQNAPHTFSNTS